jgi:hypothetical protein
MLAVPCSGGVVLGGGGTEITVSLSDLRARVAFAGGAGFILKT